MENRCEDVCVALWRREMMCEREEPVIPDLSDAWASRMLIACAHARSEIRRRRLTNL